MAKLYGGRYSSNCTLVEIIDHIENTLWCDEQSLEQYSRGYLGVAIHCNVYATHTDNAHSNAKMMIFHTFIVFEHSHKDRVTLDIWQFLIWLHFFSKCYNNSMWSRKRKSIRLVSLHRPTIFFKIWKHLLKLWTENDYSLTLARYQIYVTVFYPDRIQS